MLYLIGLGLSEKGYSREAYDLISKADKVYVENYTVDFPYEIKSLEKQFKGKKFVLVDRDFVESMEFLKESKKTNVAFLVYGSPLIATTHISLIQEARKNKVKYKVIHNASILDALTVTGLQIYKFGKIASMPKWEKNFVPESFIEIVRENQKINAHTLILTDISLEFEDAIKQIEISTKNKKIKLDKILICQSLGTKNQKIFYMMISELKSKKIKKPYCIVIPSKLHFMEEEVLRSF